MATLEVLAQRCLGCGGAVATRNRTFLFADAQGETTVVRYWCRRWGCGGIVVVDSVDHLLVAPKRAVLESGRAAGLWAAYHLSLPFLESEAVAGHALFVGILGESFGSCCGVACHELGLGSVGVQADTEEEGGEMVQSLLEPYVVSRGY